MEELVKQKKKEEIEQLLSDFGNYLRQNYSMSHTMLWKDDIEGIDLSSKDIAKEFLLDYEVE